MTGNEFDVDWVVVGSGFGGSVSALRLAEKGYSVAVLECGSRFRDEDFAASTLREPRRYFWWPKWGMRGVLRMTFFKDVFVVSGSGVGGGSLGYANTLYRARPSFFQDRQWVDLGNWEAELTPHYDTAERMLGVVEYEGMGPADVLLKEYAEEIGVGETFTNTKVGVFFDNEPEPEEEEEQREELGVEIEVTPAGKSTRKLSLLSGGEKSLVALAFVFAVFLARPCPFYILDEVEAALDDANIDRFLQLVRRFSDRAQFVIVTHQKRTMDAADVLYGVTMGDDGVTRVVSRRLPREEASIGESEGPRPFAGISAEEGAEDGGSGLGAAAVERPPGPTSGSVEAA
jgi:choline dehydrogenase-like flavoprotein